MSEFDLSIIIVNYNTKKLALECVSSVIETLANISYEIILVDNSSEQIEVIESVDNDKIKCYHIDNKGYANANNFGYSKSKGINILFLNPDTIVYENTIEECLKKLTKDRNIGALGCKVIREDGTLDHACRRGFPTPFNSLCYFSKIYKVFRNNPKLCGYTFSNIDDNISMEVDSLTGAFMMVKRSVLDKVGLFDEIFFMYGEDIDLCFRIKLANYKIFYYADYTILHKKYQSGIAKSSPIVIKNFYEAMIIFYDKNYKSIYNSVLTFFICLAIQLIMFYKLAKNRIFYNK